MPGKGLLIGLLVSFIPAGCSFLDPKPDPSRFFALASLPRAGQSAQLDLEHFRAGERQAQPAQPEERVALTRGRQAGDRLVAPGIQG